MNEIVVARSCEAKYEADLLEMFRLRHKVFKKRLGWDVEDHGGLEKDRFDEEDAVYVLVRGRNSSVSGCWRLLPTTGPNMLKDIFPQLLRGESKSMSQFSNVWELSRFAVITPAGRDDLAQGGISPVTNNILNS